MPNNTQRVDTTNFDYVNCEILGGSWHTRRGFVDLYSAPSGSELVWAGSYVPQSIDSVQTLVLLRDNTSGEVTLVCLDEQYSKLWESDPLCAVRPRAVSLNVLGGQAFLTSPDFDTQAGWLGARLYPAVKGTSLLATRTTLDVPRGIGRVFAGRLAIATDDQVWFSEAGSPTSFTAFGVMDPPGSSVRGLEVDGSGSLIICMADGVLRLGEDASLTYDVRGDANRISDHGVAGWERTTAWAGAVFAVAPGEGVRELSSGRVYDINHLQGASGTLSPEPFRAPLHSEACRLSSSGSMGLCLRSGSGTWVGLGGSKGSWWYEGDEVIEGFIPGHLGEPVVFCRSGLKALMGRTGVSGGFSGRIIQPPDQNRTCRRILFSAACPGVSVTVRTDKKSPDTKTMTTRNRVLPSTWDGSYLATGSVSSQGFDCNEQGEEVLLEVKVDSGQVRLSEALSSEWLGYGEGRVAP
jgi:hypothetical protein